ncbi:hypothetical protein JD844_009554, partial [Phrynosoma platyrhinos]
QRPNPGVGLPPAKLVPDQQPLGNQIPNEILPFELPFANFPIFFPQNRLELGSPNVQEGIMRCFQLYLHKWDLSQLHKSLLGFLSLEHKAVCSLQARPGPSLKVKKDCFQQAKLEPIQRAQRQASIRDPQQLEMD